VFAPTVLRPPTLGASCVFFFYCSHRHLYFPPRGLQLPPSFSFQASPSSLPPEPIQRFLLPLSLAPPLFLRLPRFGPLFFLFLRGPFADAGVLEPVVPFSCLLNSTACDGRCESPPPRSALLRLGFFLFTRVLPPSFGRQQWSTPKGGSVFSRSSGAPPNDCLFPSPLFPWGFGEVGTSFPRAAKPCRRPILGALLVLYAKSLFSLTRPLANLRIQVGPSEHLRK